VGELFVVLGDVAVLTVWLTGLFLVRLAIDPLIYGLNLKVEFLILNRLTGMTQQRAELRHIAISMNADSIDNAGTTTAVATQTAVQFSPRHSQLAMVTVDQKRFHDSGTAAPTYGLDANGEPTRVDQCENQSSQELAPRSTEIRESLDSTERQYLGRIGLKHTGTSFEEHGALPRAFVVVFSMKGWIRVVGDVRRISWGLQCT
jgi:hypothetical protein